MGKAGRKRKTGRRTPSGQLSRVGNPKVVKGNERAAAMRDRFGSYATEALGRAYFGGLLGGRDDPLAMERYRKGAELAAVWRRHYAPAFRSALNDNPRGVVNLDESRRAQSEYHWMRREIDALDREGFGSWFHQLALAEHPDGGPQWLDRLLAGLGGEGDRRILGVNIKALDSIGTHRDSTGNRRVDIPLYLCHGRR